ncbi:hypothetical protein [Curtobacterium sp. MCSS17_007]|uniref:hypothetical protein n=1 Tax=Curtobacterium sp. MCSS17_007 TaxID=2175646 RepID=UPI000DA806D5|nr:hypothetical protein [Curtobacterium sp. MCSS17_007]WIE74505.1 hypothetical protein DEJ22_009440 [Curtobacterium sp. MCSS17_007]
MTDKMTPRQISNALLWGTIGSLIASFIIALLGRLSTDVADNVIGAIVAIIIFVLLMIFANRKIVPALETGDYSLWYSFLFTIGYPFLATGICILGVLTALSLADFIRA